MAEANTLTSTTPSIDWKAERDRIDLVAVATRFLGPPQGRRGEGGRKKWWRCPFHDDANPSFCINPGTFRWKCFGCGESGDAVTLVMKLEGRSFPEALAYLVAGGTPSWSPSRRGQPSTARPKPNPQPEGWVASSSAVVEVAEGLLWAKEGEKALAYLRGRGLTDETVRRARLGLIRDDRPGCPAGITIPWFGPRLSMVNVRRASGSDPKYKVFTGSRRGGIYPDPKTVKAGKPLVIVEGELDALLLGQELEGVASVVTLGCAGDRADNLVLSVTLAATPWLVACDADEAGDKAAASWLAYKRSRRVRPPGPHKDWTDAHLGGVNLRRWWEGLLGGNPDSPLYGWDELNTWRWAPAQLDDEPGIVIPRDHQHEGIP